MLCSPDAALCFGEQELLIFLDLAWPNAIQINSQSNKKCNFCFLSYLITFEGISKVSAVRSGLDIMIFNTKLIFPSNTVYGAKWPAGHTLEQDVLIVRLKPESRAG